MINYILNQFVLQECGILLGGGLTVGNSMVPSELTSGYLYSLKAYNLESGKGVID